jgi:hypothetical protein
MHSQNNARSRLILRGFILGLLALFAAASPLYAHQSANDPNDSMSLPQYSAALNPPCPVAIAPVALAFAEDAGATLEDSDEMFRVDAQQRACRADRLVSDSKIPARACPTLHPSISPPLLV